MVVGNFGQQNRLYLNLQRQLDVPVLPYVGGTYTLDAYARYGPPGVVDVVIPFVSTARASIPLPPLGTLYIDPTQASPIAPFLIPQPAGVASVSLTIPNVPALAGVRLYSQALMVHYPLTERLSNGTAVVIR
jgi:hypothetical protein